MKTRQQLAQQHFLGTGAELGVARGDFTVTLLENCRIRKLFAVDRWNDHHDAAEYLRTAERLAHYRRCVPLRMTFAEAAKLIPDESLDFVYVDGYAHTGQEKGGTLAEWWPKLKAGGVLAGHDFHPRWPLTVAAVESFCAEQSTPLNLTASPDDGGDQYPSWWTIKGAPDVPKPVWLPSLPIAQSSRVILVGNGPSLTDHENGARIDAFDEVVRFNWYAIRGFEKHSGTRTTLWCTFGRGSKPRDPGEVPPRALYVHGEKAKRFEVPVPEACGIPRAFFNGVQERLRWRSTRADKTRLLPSSGLVVALFLLEEMAIPSITITGFDHFSKVNTGRHHYWLRQSFKPPPEHDGEAEAAWFAELQTAGQITDLQP